jgi:hypothetical protein
LFDDRYAPTTDHFAFIEADAPYIAEKFLSWRQQLPHRRGRVTSTELPDSFPTILDRLLPLTVGWSARYLMVPTGSRWTAFFDSSHQGTDWSAPAAIARHCLGVRCLYVCCVVQPPRQHGAVQLWLEGPGGEGPLHVIRTIAAVNDDGWTWDLSGTPQPFEEPENYTARRKRDRFTPEMLARTAGRSASISSIPRSTVLADGSSRNTPLATQIIRR